MMTGIFTANGEPRIRFFLKGAGAILHEVEAVVDTGFNDELTLNQALIDALGLVFDHKDETVLADNSIVECGVYRATIIWDGQERLVFVQSAEGDALVGTLLMDGYKLCVEMWTGGAVTLEIRP